MNIKELIDYLSKLPPTTEVVTTNSYAWHSREVQSVKKEEFGRYIYIKDNPEKNGRAVNHPCLVIHDDKRTDY